MLKIITLIYIDNQIMETQNKLLKNKEERLVSTDKDQLIHLNKEERKLDTILKQYKRIHDLNLISKQEINNEFLQKQLDRMINIEISSISHNAMYILDQFTDINEEQKVKEWIPHMVIQKYNLMVEIEVYQDLLKYINGTYDL